MIRLFRHYISLRLLVLFFGDILVIILSIVTALRIRFLTGNFESIVNWEMSWPKVIVFVFPFFFSIFLMDLYNLDNLNGKIGKKELLTRIVFSLFLAFPILATMYYFLPHVMFGRGVFLLSFLSAAIDLTIWRFFMEYLPYFPIAIKKVLIIGTGPLAKRLGDLIHNNAMRIYDLSGFVYCTNELLYVPLSQVLGRVDNLLRIVEKEDIKKIVVSLNEKRGVFPLQTLLDCKLKGIEVVDAPTFYEQLTGKLLIEETKPSWFIFSDGFKESVFYRSVKRVFDIIFSFFGLLILSPLMFIIAVLIKLDAKGSVFFKQERVGVNEKEFTIYKFRTMVNDAEKDTGPVWTQSHDARITRVGKILRKARLDEIPQMINVLKGEMSFVGPRPEREFFINELKKQIPYYSNRHTVKPGITGWAQVRYNYGSSLEDAIEKLRYELYYIKNMSFFLDMLIILETVKVMLSGKGGR
jgi:sugar transferase (PEP-CTERM system associated)